MAIVGPSTLRSLPAGYYARHTPVGTPGVGVPGGFAQYDAGGSNARPVIDGAASPYNLLSYADTPSDATGAIQSLINACIVSGSRGVIPPGVYQVYGTVGSGLYGGGYTLAGSGMGVTTLISHGGQVTFNNGNASQFNYPTTGNVLTAPLAQGATSFTVADASPFSPGQLVRLEWENQIDKTQIEAGETPVFHNEGNEYVRRQIVRISSIAGNTVTFSPGVYHRPGTNLAARVYLSGFSQYNGGVGLEDITLDGNGTNPYSLVQFSDCYGCWMSRVETKRALNYNTVLTSTLRFEMRGCYNHLSGTGGSNGGGLLTYGACSSLIEDCIFMDGAPVMEINFSSSGNVFSAIYCNATANLNHGPGNYGNLYIRSIFDVVITDGYFGPSECDTFVESWIRQIALRRFTFKSNHYNCIHGYTTDTGTFNWLTAQGQPNMIYGGYNGHRSEFFAGEYPHDWPYDPPQYLKLVERTSNTTGKFHCEGLMDMEPNVSHVKILVEGIGYLGYYPNIIDSKTFTFDVLDTNAVLPPVNSLMRMLAPGQGGYQDWNDDVPNSMDIRACMSISPSVIFPAQSLAAGDTIWEPLDPSGAPDFWQTSGCAWPMVNRSSPSSITNSANPAGKRVATSTIFAAPTTAATPVFTPSPGSFYSTQVVAMSCSTSGAVIHYTTDGSTPTELSPVYSRPITISATTTVKAIAVKSGLSNSGVRSGLFTIGVAPPPSNTRRTAVVAARRR